MKDGNLAPSGAVSPAKAAQLVGCHRTTITRAIEAGELPAARRNKSGHWSILIEDLEVWHGSSVTRAAPGPEQRHAQRVDDLQELLKDANRRLGEVNEAHQAARDREEGLRDIVEMERGRVAQLSSVLAAARSDIERLGQEREAAVKGQSAALESVNRLSGEIKRMGDQISARDALIEQREAEIEEERGARAEAARLAKERAGEIKKMRQRAWWERLLNR